MENRAIANGDEKNEIIVYQPEGTSFHIEAILECETVWLTQAQICSLYNSSKSNISEHIKHIFKEGELSEAAVVRNFRTTGSDGKLYNVKHFNLDVIISVGYRVKSIQGTRFRQWANQVLKDHLLRGASINQRFMLTEERVNRQLINHEKRLDELDSQGVETKTRLASLEKQVDFFVKANLPPSEGLLNAKSWWSGYEFAAKLVRSATKEVVIIDPFADDVVLRLIAKRAPGVNAIVYSARVNRTMTEEVKLMNREKPHVNSRNMQNVHDRFIIIDETVYHIGASIRDLGNKLTAFSVLSLLTKAQLLGMIK